MSANYRTLRRALDDLHAQEEVVLRERQKEEDYRQKVSAAFRACREAKELSLREVARRLKVSVSYLSDFELGRRWMSEDNMDMLLSIVGPLQIQDIIERIQQNKILPAIPGKIAASTPSASKGGKS